jgi:hypothetical protein
VREGSLDIAGAWAVDGVGRRHDEAVPLVPEPRVRERLDGL